METIESQTEGQTLIELTIFLGPVVLLLILVAKVMQSEWNQAHCAYLTFEMTHARRIAQGDVRFLRIGQEDNRSLLRKTTQVRVEEMTDRWRGTGVCGNAKEIVELPKLESARW